MTDPINPDEIERLHQKLLSLPPVTLDVFLANRVEGMSYAEIGKAYGLLLWQVRLHMLRAIIMLTDDL